MTTVHPGETARADVATADEIRAHFPALARVHAGHPVAYFDGPGGTQVPVPVVEAMNDYLYHHNANTHWRYPTSEETDAALLAAREACADFLGGAPDEIAFGQNMTTLTFHLARALGAGWGAGDEIVVTELDHQANVAPWRRLARERGVTIRLVPLRADDGTLEMDAMESAIGPRTRLVAVGAASNAIGTVTDVTVVAAMAKAVGALTFVDAVHLAPHHLVDVGAIGCDFLACSAYKFYGPHVGILWGRRDLLASLDVPKLDPAPDTAPERMETGTLNHEGIVGAGAAVDFLASLARTGASRRERLQRSFAALHERGERLTRRLREGLQAVAGVRVYGPGAEHPRTPTVSFTVDGVTTDDVAIAAARRGVFVSNGDFYASTVIARLGREPDGLVRAGCACYTTADEVDRLVEVVAATASRG